MADITIVDGVYKPTYNYSYFILKWVYLVAHYPRIVSDRKWVSENPSDLHGIFVGLIHL